MKLYHSQILALDKEPYHFESLQDDPIFIANNPTCGDRFKIYSCNKDEQFDELRFYGFGCSVSKSSTSLFLKYLEKNGPETTAQCANAFIQYVHKRIDQPPWEELKIFAEVRNYPARLDCVLLPWKSFLAFRESI